MLLLCKSKLHINRSFLSERHLYDYYKIEKDGILDKPEKLVLKHIPCMLSAQLIPISAHGPWHITGYSAKDPSA